MLNLNIQLCCYHCLFHLCLRLVANFQKETTGAGFSVEEVVRGRLWDGRPQPAQKTEECGWSGLCRPGLVRIYSEHHVGHAENMASILCALGGTGQLTWEHMMRLEP